MEAWLPGTEGQGVADVLFGNYNPTGRLPDTWMQSASQQPINAGDGKPALFALGAGSGFPATQNPYNVVHRLYLVFSGPTASDFVNVNWMQFLR